MCRDVVIGNRNPVLPNRRSHRRARKPGRFSSLFVFGVAVVGLTLALFSCAGSVKNTLTRSADRAKFSRIQKQFVAELDSLEAIASSIAPDTLALAYDQYIDRTLQEAQRLLRRNYYKFQVDRIVQFAATAQSQQWANLHGRFADRHREFDEEAERIVTLTSSGDTRGGLTMVHELGLAADSLQAELGLRLDLTRRKRIGAALDSSWALEDPEEPPELRLEETVSQLSRLETRIRELMEVIPRTREKAGLALGIGLDRFWMNEASALVERIDRAHITSEAGRHREAMREFSSILTQARRIAERQDETNTDPELAAIGYRLPPEVTAHLQWHIELSERNRRVSEFNFALARYNVLARRKPGMRDVCEEIDQLLALEGVNGELRSGLERLRRLLR